MVKQQRFQPPGSSQTFKVQLNQEEKIPVQMVGELSIQNDQVYCKGQSYRTPQGILDNVLILNEYSSLNERIREDYMILYVENKINNLQAVRSSDLCQQRTGSFSEEPQPLGDGSYMLRRGDIIFQMKCPKKRGAITEKPACYSHIPVDGDLWIHPISRLRSIHSTMTVCNQKFPLTIRIQEGTWVAINSQIIPVATPSSPISEKLGN